MAEVQNWIKTGTISIPKFFVIKYPMIKCYDVDGF
jgi:hypothetical protein